MYGNLILVDFMGIEEDLQRMEDELNEECGLFNHQRSECYGCGDCSDLRMAYARLLAEKQRRDAHYELYLDQQECLVIQDKLYSFMKNAYETLHGSQLKAFSETIEALCKMAGVPCNVQPIAAVNHSQTARA